MLKEIAINEIENFKIGHSQNKEAGTGCSVIIFEKGAVAGVDVRGGAPATHETDLLNSVNLIETIHAVVLSGGSSFGLEATAGVMSYLEENKVGFNALNNIVPIVTGCSLFDLTVGNNKIRPDKKMGYDACLNSKTNNLYNGCIGAGTGCSVGKILGLENSMKTGLGSAALQLGDLKVGALVAVNALGNIVDLHSGKFLAGLLDEKKEKIISTEETFFNLASKSNNFFSSNTTIGCVITNARLTKPQANKISSISHDAFAKTISPVHTMFDGDTIFTLTSNEIETAPDIVGILATRAMMQAINNAALYAEKMFNLESFNSLNHK